MEHDTTLTLTLDVVVEYDVDDIITGDEVTGRSVVVTGVFFGETDIMDQLARFEIDVLARSIEGDPTPGQRAAWRDGHRRAMGVR
jgi:hypothetical protein